LCDIENRAILKSYDCGPYFGNNDLALYGNNSYDNSYRRKGDYEKKIREIGDIVECEVFQVTKINV
jgi:hypothetical protein